MQTTLEFDFELTDLTVDDATPVPIASSTPMRNKKETTIDIDETNQRNIKDTSKEFLQIHTKEIENLCSERDSALEKIKKLENNHLSYENLKENLAKSKYYAGVNVEVFDYLFDYLQAEKDIEAVKSQKRETQIIVLQGPIGNDIDKIKTEHTQFENQTDQVGYSKTTGSFHSRSPKAVNEGSSISLKFSPFVTINEISIS